MEERITVEVCVESAADACAAAAAGADRLELCAGLALGGLTPGPGLLAEVLARVELPVVVLCRPRRGDFLYAPADAAALARDVDAARAAGAAGVALGALERSGDVDRARLAEWIDRARPLEVCFHRAFDLVRDQHEALEVLVELGVERVLTSGGEPDVVQGLDRLAHLSAVAGERIEVMPGGGVSEHNVASLVAATRVRAVHLSAGRTVPSPMARRREGPRMGASQVPGEHELRVTDPQRVRAVRRALRD